VSNFENRLASRIAKEWKKRPKGWTDESVEKFWGTLTSDNPDHPVTECIDKMDGKLSNPGAFCGGLADEMDPGWRSRGREKKAAARVDTRTRAQVNKAFRSAGLDGNGRFQSPGRALAVIFNVLNNFGYEADTVVSSHRLNVPSGSVNIDIALSNRSDPFSPTPVDNTVVHFQWQELQPDRFEAIVYLS